MGGFLQKTSESIGKAIPNEFSKLNSVLQYVPLLGQINQGLSAIDAGATAYGDTGNPFTAGASGFQGFYGSIDPGRYGSPNSNNDWANTIGNIGNLFKGMNGQGGGQFGGSQTYQNLLNLFNQFGSQQTQQAPQQQPSFDINDKQQMALLMSLLNRQQPNIDLGYQDYGMNSGRYLNYTPTNKL